MNHEEVFSRNQYCTCHNWGLGILLYPYLHHEREDGYLHNLLLFR
jgi:hypothetical protein